MDWLEISFLTEDWAYLKENQNKLMCWFLFFVFSSHFLFQVKFSSSHEVRFTPPFGTSRPTSLLTCYLSRHMDTKLAYATKFNPISMISFLYIFFSLLLERKLNGRKKLSLSTLYYKSCQRLCGQINNMLAKKWQDLNGISVKGLNLN